MQKINTEGKYFKTGLMLVLTVCAIFVIYDIILGQKMILSYLRGADMILRPVTWGLIIAYLLAPIVNFIERKIMKPVALEGLQKRKQKSWIRLTSVLATLAFIVLLFVILLRILIPQVIDSIMQIVGNMDTYIATVNQWVTDLGKYDDKASKDLAVFVDTAYTQISQWITEFMNKYPDTDILTMVSKRVMDIFYVVKDLLLGVIVAAYILGMKETIGAQGKKILYGFTSSRSAGKILSALDYANNVFGGFIRGKLLDSLIIGIICFVGCQILGIPFAPLVAVIVGITNIIPFFGPFIGAVPCCVLIVLVDPIKCLIFILFILALQQFDGNILGPKILGDSTGLASLWVIIAIIVGGAIAGPLGMLIGCPLFALIYAAVRHCVNTELEKKNLPISTDVYRQRTKPDDIVSAENDGSDK